MLKVNRPNYHLCLEPELSIHDLLHPPPLPLHPTRNFPEKPVQFVMVNRLLHAKVRNVQSVDLINVLTVIPQPVLQNRPEVFQHCIVFLKLGLTDPHQSQVVYIIEQHTLQALRHPSPPFSTDQVKIPTALVKIQLA